jgi:hypothetical protein
MVLASAAIALVAGAVWLALPDRAPRDLPVAPAPTPAPAAEESPAGLEPPAREAARDAIEPAEAPEPAQLDVALEPDVEVTATVLVLTDHAGAPVTTARIDVYRRQGDEDEYVAHRNPPHTGVIQLSGLEAGHYVLSTESARHFPCELEFDVGPSHGHRVVCEMTAIPTAGDVSGRLVGLDDYAELEVELQSYAYVDTHFDVEVTEVESEAGLEGVFAFHDVPGGEYLLSVSDDLFRPWRPASIVVSAPAEGVVFRCDPPELRKVFTAVFDEDTGKLVPARWLIYSSRNGYVLEGDLIEGRDLFGNEIGGPFRWFVRAEGYTMAYGDERDLVRGEEGQWIRVGLSRNGWCEVVRAQTAGEVPLSGVSVLVDGSVVGVTGDEGILLIERPEAPATLGLRLGGYRIAEHSEIRPDGTYEVWDNWEILGVMERAE